MRKLLVLVSMCLIAVVVHADKYEVVRVIDGDTIVAIKNGETVKIRLYAVDAPEHRGKQPMWEDAKNMTSDLVLGKSVEIQKHGVDMYQRVVGVVYMDNGTSLNEELLKRGLAVYAKDYCKDQDYCMKLEAAESDARNAGFGLWSLDSFILPSTWRATTN